MAQNPKLRIGILGCGPSGIAAALALENYCSPNLVDVSIIEKNSGVSDYEGVEYAIQDDGCLALERIGVKDQVLKRGNPLKNLCFYDERKKKIHFALEVDPKYTYEVYRQDFLNDMEAALKFTTVVRNCFIEGLEFDDSGKVTVNIRGGNSKEFDLVIAAEGIHSPTRRQLFPDQCEIVEHDFAILYLLIEAKPGQTMPEHYLNLANGSYLQFNMGEFSTNSFFPLSNGRLAIAISFDHKTRKRMWKECGVNENAPWASIDAGKKLKIAKMLASSSSVFDSLFEKILDYVPDWNSKKIYSWTMRDNQPLKMPYAPNGNVVLIGDAAHAMLPCLGRGATTAIEDAEVLGRFIADYANKEWKPTATYDDYKKNIFMPFTRARYPRWEDLLWRSRHAIRNYVGQGESSGFTIAPFVPIPIIRYMMLIYEWVVDVIAKFWR
ncbi:hypothetical protein HK098_001633 [Nowakowskiella sp. JEL0407]|nr:hypothetical protein HK098_001633 [Nowakowskiella sp. JEL0407]